MFIETVDKLQIFIKCKCGNRTEKSLCQAGAEELQDYQRMAVSMMAMRMSDDQSIDISTLTAEKKAKEYVILFLTLKLMDSSLSSVTYVVIYL